VTDGPAPGSRVRAVFLGSGGFGVGSLTRLADGRDDIEVIGVVTSPPRPAGRKQRLTTSKVDDAAEHLHIRTILTPERLRDRAAIESVLALHPQLAVLADYGQIVPAALLDLEFGALNLHPSLLPTYRGATPIQAAILAGDAETGVTLMRMDSGLDTGPIVAQARVPLTGTETADLLEERLSATADGLLDRSLGPWLRGEITATPQPDAGATLTRPLRREDGRLDPVRPAIELERQVRAYRPWPGTFVETIDGRLSVLSAAVGLAADHAPGTFTREGLATADGLLRLHEIQPAGGRPMAWEAFLRGHPSIVGSMVAPAR
jgi:methionyl-tRNA formyltransferase